MLTFIFSPWALALPKAWVAKKALEAAGQLRITELVKGKAELRAELDQAHAKIVEVEGRKNSLKSNYDQLNIEYKDLEVIVQGLQREKVDAENSRDAQVGEIRNKFCMFRVHFCQRLRGICCELEGALGERRTISGVSGERYSNRGDHELVCGRDKCAARDLHRSKQKYCLFWCSRRSQNAGGFRLRALAWVGPFGRF
jgi:hypothetical protein